MPLTLLIFSKSVCESPPHTTLVLLILLLKNLYMFDSGQLDIFHRTIHKLCYYINITKSRVTIKWQMTKKRYWMQDYDKKIMNIWFNFVTMDNSCKFSVILRCKVRPVELLNLAIICDTKWCGRNKLAIYGNLNMKGKNRYGFVCMSRYGAIWRHL